MQDEPLNFAKPARPSPRRAVLVFAQQFGRDERRRRWDRRLARRLCHVDADRLNAAGAEVHLFGDAAATGLPGDRIHAQAGDDFGTRLLAATETLARLGYDEVCIVGGDCPQLAPGDVADAFAGLADGAPLALGPDHRGGCYLIALRLCDRRLLAGVRWQWNTDFAELSSRVGGRALVLREKVDVDAPADVALLCRRDGVWREIIRRLLGRAVGRPLPGPAPSAASVRQRALWQLPPPLAA